MIRCFARIARSIAVAALAAGWSGVLAAEAPSAPVDGNPITLLDRRFDFQLRRAHLQDVVKFLQDELGLTVRLDTQAIEEIGLEMDKTQALKIHQSQMDAMAKKLASDLAKAGVYLPQGSDILETIRGLPYRGVTFEEKNITLRSVLRHVLADLHPMLVYDLRDNVLWITTEDAAVYTRVYSVSDLVVIPLDQQRDESLFDAVALSLEGIEYDYDTLIEILKSTIELDAWDDAGGEGSVSPGEGTLTITQSGPVHEKIQALFSAMRKVRAEWKKENPDLAPISVTVTPAAAAREVEIERALAKSADFAFDDTTLGDVVASLRKQLQIPMRIDLRALADVELGPQSLVTFHQKNAPVGSALETMLEATVPNLTFQIDHEILLITTQEAAQVRLEIILYPVRDLIGEARGTRSARSDSWDYETLIENITTTIRADSWEEVGGEGSIVYDPYSGILIVAQTDAVHKRIAELLEEFRRIAVQLRTTEPPIAAKKQTEYVTVVYRLWQPWHEKAVVKEEDVVKLLQEMIEPESWKADEVFVRTLPSRLIIRQRKNVHRQIYLALQNLAILKPLSSAEATQSLGTAVGLGGGMMGGMGRGGGASGDIGAAGALPPGSQ